MTRHVVVVEDRAHIRAGHFPNACADLARALSALGCSVELLTTFGWAGDGNPESPPFLVSRTPKPVARIFLASEWLGHRTENMRGSARAAVWYASGVVRAAANALAVRHVVRRIGSGTDVISFSYLVNPVIAAAIDGPGRIVHHTVVSPPFNGPPQTTFGRILDRLARRAEVRRRARGGGFRLAVGNEQALEEWRTRTPYLNPVLLRHAVSREEPRSENPRGAFGIPGDARVALVFGSTHESKDLDTIWRAFSALPEWTLLVVGKVADPYETWFADHGGPPAISRRGFVDAATRADAYSAADVVVLSFVPGHLRDSAVLQDAITFGVPVLCSDDCSVASEVLAHRLGETFSVGDADALAAAVGHDPPTIARADLEAARAASSAIASAQAHLDALDAIG